MANIVILKPKDYDWPQHIPSEYLPIKKPTVEIDVEEIRMAASKGITWEQLEAYYNVDKETLKKNFYLIYTKERAKLEINLLNSMVSTALMGDTPMQKWLSANWLKMTDKSTTTIIEAASETDPKELDEKIDRLLKKMKKD